jgi:hypothetical protein
LSIPKIYIDTKWNGSHVDVLAINRDGVGDVHATLLVSLVSFGKGGPGLLAVESQFDELVEKLHNIPAHFKWIAVVVGSLSGSMSFDQYNKRRDKMYAPDGLGRIGLLQVVFEEDDDPAAHIVVKAERFRAKVSDLADSYIHAHSADWEIRA